MVDLSIVKDEKLRELIASSKRFQMMPEDAQAKIISQFSKLPEPEQKQFLEFFVGVVKEEKAKEEKIKEVIKLNEDLKEGGNKIVKMVREDKENQEVKADKKECENLLSELNS